MSQEQVQGSPTNHANATEHLIRGMEATASKAERFNTDLGLIISNLNMLALNALIEAANSGNAGRGFAVVAQEMKTLANTVKQASQGFTAEVVGSLTTRVQESRNIDSQVTGSRFADLALNLIDVIDRNLYERTCDVRWWATDSAVVGAEGNPAEACQRLGVILDSYTVYEDIWLINPQGLVICNGRPQTYPVKGADLSRSPWFTGAMQTQSGGDYITGDIHPNQLLENKVVIPYATAVREAGANQGRVIGVIVVMMNWANLADRAIAEVRLRPHEKASTQCLLVDRNGCIIAPTHHPSFLMGHLEIPAEQKQGFEVEKRQILAYAETPGFETYPGLGWRAVIRQDLK